MKGLQFRAFRLLRQILHFQSLHTCETWNLTLPRPCSSSSYRRRNDAIFSSPPSSLGISSRGGRSTRRDHSSDVTRHAFPTTCRPPKPPQAAWGIIIGLRKYCFLCMVICTSASYACSGSVLMPRSMTRWEVSLPRRRPSPNHSTHLDPKYQRRGSPIGVHYRGR